MRIIVIRNTTYTLTGNYSWAHFPDEKEGENVDLSFYDSQSVQTLKISPDKIPSFRAYLISPGEQQLFWADHLVRNIVPWNNIHLNQLVQLWSVKEVQTSKEGKSFSYLRGMHICPHLPNSFWLPIPQSPIFTYREQIPEPKSML